MRFGARIGHGLLHALAFAGFIAACTPAEAALSCTFTISNEAFGTVDLTANTTFDTTATFSANCTGGTASSTARVCPNIGSGTGGSTNGTVRFMLNGANQVSYNLYQDAARTTVWGSYLWPWPTLTPPTVDIALNSSGVGSTTRTIYGRILAGQQAMPPAAYSSSFSTTHTAISYAQSTVGNCATIGNTNAVQAAFTVTATHVAVCRIATTIVDFGTKGVLSTNTDVTGTITPTCSATTPYTISLNGGNSGAANPTLRKMANGAVQITYGLYSDSARTLGWGSTVGTNTVAGTGSGLGQALTVYGRVPVQTTPAPGTFTDTVIATVTY
ncbi:MAG TPA: spore coat protein U domain-containing protein [Xanthobacteraceae bacterium]|nr:spore coat protein U domain-containing protein [Xanthobacteraceae bacterium]